MYLRLLIQYSICHCKKRGKNAGNYFIHGGGDTGYDKKGTGLKEEGGVFSPQCLAYQIPESIHCLAKGTLSVPFVPSSGGGTGDVRCHPQR